MRRQLVVTALALSVVTTCGLIAAIARHAEPAAPPGGQQPSQSTGQAGQAVQAWSPAPVAEPAPGDRTASSARLVVQGSCVDWESGDAVGDCQVTITGAASTSTSTDGQGRFAIVSARPPDGGDIELRIAASRHLTIVRRFAAPGSVLTLGALRLRRGARVSGVLRDEHGRPQPDARIELHYGQALQRTDGFAEHHATRSRTRADGSFVFATAVPAGIVDVATPTTPPLLEHDSIALHPGRDHHLELVCRAVAAEHRIEGIARDRGGHIVARALVQAFATGAGDGPPAAWSRTDDDGRFVLYRLGKGDPSVELTALDLRSGERAAGVRIQWGTDDVELHLGGDDGIRLRVVDDRSGEPIEGYAVQCVRTTGVRSPAASSMRNDGRHVGGWTWLEGLSPGPHQLIVWPHDPRWLPNLPQAFELDEHGGSVQVALPRARPCRVRIEDEAGQPMSGAQLELLRPATGSLTRDLTDAFRHGGVRGPLNIRLATATTDAEGRANLRWFADPQPLQLRVHGAHTAAHVEHGVHVGNGELLVRVGAAGQLQLDLQGAGGSRVLLQEIAGERQLPLAWQQPHQLDQQGRLQLPVPAGQWQLRLAHRPEHDDRTAAVWVTAPSPIAIVDITANRTTELALDLRAALATGELTGSVFVDGQPARHLVLQFGSPGDDGQLRCVHQLEVQADAQGRFRFDGLLAGSYALHVRTTCAGRPLLVPTGAWQRLQPGQRLELPPFALTTAPATVVLRDAAGEPVADAQLILSAGAGFALLATPDEQGRVQLDDLPTARYELRLRRGTSNTELGTFDVAAGRANRHVVEIGR